MLRRLLSLGKFPYIIVAFFVSVQVVLFIAQSAHVNATEYIEYADPPLLEATSQPAPNHHQFDLYVKYTTSEIYNPATKHSDHVYLRSYVDNPNNLSSIPHVAPTIDVDLANTLGSVISVNLHNQLPNDEKSACSDHSDHSAIDLNTPHCFNVTNLHSHGLWVNPKDYGDNVFENVLPGNTRPYEYKIDPDHPSGTFWYHPHKHGSTALQVANGMAGALILHGHRLPVIDEKSDEIKKPGDIDILLDKLEPNKFKERTLVLQQIPYACLRDDIDDIKNRKDFKIKDIKQRETVEGKQLDWFCEEHDTGIVNAYDQFGFGTWQKSGRHTSINGQVLPHFEAKAGDIERWRLIHAGVGETIKLQFHRAKRKDIDTSTNLTTAQAIADNCIEADRLDFHVIAEDGLTRPYILNTDTKILQPGYRSDTLMVFPEAGDYCLVDEAVAATSSPSRTDEDRRLLGVVHVRSDNKELPSENLAVKEYLREKLVDAAIRAIPAAAVQERVVSDLKGLGTHRQEDGETALAGEIKLNAFVPHLKIKDEEVNGHQEMVYYMDTLPIDSHGQRKTKFEISRGFYPNFEPHEYQIKDFRELTLGKTEEWKMASYFGSHPFHIHVNPFQIVEVLDPEGNDVSGIKCIPKQSRENKGYANDQSDEPSKKCQENENYTGLKGAWKDSIWVEGLNVQPLPYVATRPDLADEETRKGIAKFLQDNTYTVVVRTRYQKYDGKFVQHCHILDHEDQGMMENICIESEKYSCVKGD